MKNKPPEDTNELLVRLYALSHEQPMAHFQNTALALLKPVVAFDAAIWGTATTGADGIDIHSFHLHNKTSDMVAGYEEVKHLDSASSGMFDKPKATRAFDSNNFFDGRDKRPIRDFMTKFEQPHFLLTTDLKAQANHASSQLHWVTLYRAKQNAHYSAVDVGRLHVFAPHLKQALTLNRASHLSKVAVSGGGGGSRFAQQALPMSKAMCMGMTRHSWHLSVMRVVKTIKTACGYRLIWWPIWQGAQRRLFGSIWWCRAMQSTG